VDTAGAFHPHRSLAGRRNTLILHGQNMDALVNGHMTVLQEFHEAGYFSAAAAGILKTDNRLMRRDRAFAKNLMFTDAYLTDPEFQRQSTAYMATTFEGALPDPNPGPDGVLRGLMSYQMPNILSDLDLPIPQVAILDAEIASFRDWLGRGERGPQMQFDLMRFLSYSAVVAKRFQGYPIGPNSELYLPANSGPLLSYFSGRPRRLADANRPKREVFAYARQATGQRYMTMTRTVAPDRLDWTPTPGQPIGQTEVFAAARQALSGRDIAALRDGIDDAGTLAHLDRLLDEFRGGSGDGQNRPRIVRLANLAWILQTVRTLRQDAG